MEAERGLGAGRTIIEEVRQIIAFVEEVTGLTSRWNGGLLILEDGTGEARAMQMLSRVSYLAKKEWNCSITVMESVLQDDLRWRTLLHEGLHSVSVGLTEPEYQRFAPLNGDVKPLTLLDSSASMPPPVVYCDNIRRNR